MLVARFVGEGAGAALVGLTDTNEYHEEVNCRLVVPNAK